MYPHEKIKGAQAEKGMTNEQIAEAAGVNINTVTAVRKGKNVKLDTLGKVANAVGFDLEVRFIPKPDAPASDLAQV